MLELVFRHFCTFFLAILILLIAPLLLVVSSPLFLIRYLIGKLALVYRPDLSKIVTSRSCLCATKKLYSEPTGNIIAQLLLEGNLHIDEARKVIQKGLIDARFPNGDLKYPELQSFQTTWAGYLFWKKVSDFDLKNHVKVYEKSQSKSLRFTEEDVQEICQELAIQKWTKDRPLWEMIVVPNCYINAVEGNSGPFTTVIFRFQHSLGDGYSFQLILFNEFLKDPNSIDVVVPNYFKRDFFTTLLFAIAFPFRTAYGAAEIAVKSYPKLPFLVTSKGGKLLTSISNRVYLEKLKEIKNHYKVTISSLINAVITGAVRETLITKGIKVPTDFPVLIPLPLPRKTASKLRNYATMAVLDIAIGTSDAVSRLKLSHQNYRKLKKSPMPFLGKLAGKILGSYPSCIINMYKKSFSIPIVISHFPVGLSFISLNGHKVKEISSKIGLSDVGLGLTVSVISYVNIFRFSVAADSTVLTQTEVNEIPRLIEEQIDILYRNVINDV